MSRLSDREGGLAAITGRPMVGLRKEKNTPITYTERSFSLSYWPTNSSCKLWRTSRNLTWKEESLLNPAKSEPLSSAKL